VLQNDHAKNAKKLKIERNGRPSLGMHTLKTNVRNNKSNFGGGLETGFGGCVSEEYYVSLCEPQQTGTLHKISLGFASCSKDPTK
jgi:hypothetical protein